MLIKKKLTVNTIIFTVSMLAMLLLMNFSLSSLKQDIGLTQQIGNIEAQVLQLRLYEKDFVVRKKNNYSELFHDQVMRIQLSINNLKKELKRLDISGEDAIVLSHLLTNYQSLFNMVVDIQKRIGFEPKQGYLGQLEVAATEVDEAMGDSVIFLKMMLEVRNSEKNYLLVHDDKYISKFEHDVKVLYERVQASFLITPKKKAIIEALEIYQASFFSLAGEQKILGYDEEQAFQRAMNASALKVQVAQAQLAKKANQAINEYTNLMTQITYSLFFLALVISISIGWAISRNIINAISQFKSSIIKISDSNDLTIVVATKGNDELSDMAAAFNYMISNVRHLLSSLKKLEAAATPETKAEIISEKSFWDDFIFEETEYNEPQ